MRSNSSFSCASAWSGRLRDPGREGREFVGGEAHSAAHRLAVAINLAIGAAHQLVAVLACDLDEIAENAIVLDLERGDGGFAAVFRFQPGDHAPTLVAQASHLVERRMRPGTDETAIARKIGRFGDKQGLEQLYQLGRLRDAFDERGAGGGEFSRRRLQRVADATQGFAQHARGRDTVADTAEIARAATLDREACERSGNIRRAAQRLAQMLAQIAIGEQGGNCVVTRGNPLDIGERRGKA